MKALVWQKLSVLSSSSLKGQISLYFSKVKSTQYYKEQLVNIVTTLFWPLTFSDFHLGWEKHIDSHWSMEALQKRHIIKTQYNIYGNLIGLTGNWKMAEISQYQKRCCYISVSCPVSSNSHSGSTSSVLIQCSGMIMFPPRPPRTSRGQHTFLNPLLNLQNADKLYKGQLSEFTPLASLHAPPKASDQRRGSAHHHHHHRSGPHQHRSEPLTKKTMFTRWQRAPDYCTFTPLLRFADGSSRFPRGHAYNGAGPETSVWQLNWTHVWTLMLGAELRGPSGGLDWSDLRSWSRSGGCRASWKTAVESDGSPTHSTPAAMLQRAQIPGICLRFKTLQRIWSTQLTFVSLALIYN